MKQLKQYSADHNIDNLLKKLEHDYSIRRNVISKLLSVYYPEDFIQIHSINHVEIILRAFGKPIDDIHGRLFLAQARLLEVKNLHAIMKQWSTNDFSDFVWNAITKRKPDDKKSQRDNKETQSKVPTIFVTGYDDNNLIISKQSNILGWKERPSRLSLGDYVFVYNTTTDKIETCFQIKSLSNKTIPIWYEEISSDPQALLYKNRWDADIICDGLDIGLNVIFNIEPFMNDKKTFSLLVRNKVPRSLEDARYKEFRTFLLDKCGIKFEQKNYLLLLTQPNTEWDDEEGRIYHYGNNVPNYLQVIPGSKAIFYLLEHGNIRPIGRAQIHSINKEDRNRTTPKGRTITENIAQLQDYEKLDIADEVRFEFEQRVKSLPNYNNQHSIIPITKEVYDLVISVKKEEERATYTLNELTKNTFIKQSEFEEWEDILKEKGQVIFYGPPGTGKTFVATEFSKYLIYKYGGTYELVQFHPSYSYEDFVEGIKPQIRNGMLEYIAKDAIFKKFCKRATLNGLQKYILIIDEINRGNLSKIFGELIYSLEYRGEGRRSRKEITLPYTNEHFTIPENIWIIGTMNSADRSIALVDYALRRRFYFVELMPDARILDAFFTVTHPRINKDKVIQFFNQINETITKDEKLGRHFQLGHSYFMRTNMDEKMLKRIWRYAVKPILEEYYFEEQEQIDRFEQLLEQAIKMG